MRRLIQKSRGDDSIFFLQSTASSHAFSCANMRLDLTAKNGGNSKKKPPRMHANGRETGLRALTAEYAKYAEKDILHGGNRGTEGDKKLLLTLSCPLIGGICGV